MAKYICVPFEMYTLKPISLLGYIKVRTNKGSDKQRFRQTEVQTNRGSDKQRRPLACPPCLRKIVYFCSSYCLRIYIFFPWMHHTVQIGNIIALDASKSSPWMHQSSDKQRFGQTEVRTNRGFDTQFFSSKKFFSWKSAILYFSDTPWVIRSP